jgi:hypothetical protein
MPLAAGIYIAGLLGTLVYTASIFLRLLTFPIGKEP